MEKYIEYLKELDNGDRSGLIKLHMKLDTESKFYSQHHRLFGGKSAKTYDRRRLEEQKDCFPIYHPLIFVIYLLHTLGDVKLARKEATLLSMHPQTLLACEVLITYYEKGEIEDALNLVRDDKPLRDAINYHHKENDLEFIPKWCRHALLVVFAFLRGSVPSHPHILYLEYDIVRDTFHPLR